MCLIFLGSCSTNKHLSNVSRETEKKTLFVRDTIHVYESEFLHKKNDTLIIEHIKNIYTERLIYDSIFINNNDTIYVYPDNKSDVNNNVSNFKYRLMQITLGVLLVLMFYFWLKNKIPFL